MTSFELTDHWTVHAADTNETIPAQVPGNIHLDLLRAGRIPDPYYADNEKQVQWVGESDWIYRCDFRIAKALLGHERVLLRCEGFDSLATIRVNGKKVARTENMFRTWEFDVKPVLRVGDNRLEITCGASKAISYQS